MAKIFISFSSTDIETALAYYEAFLALGYYPWISHKHILPGDNWDKCIEDALRASSTVVALVSEHSVESRHVRAEVESAQDLNIRVVPIIISQCRPPMNWKMLQLTNGIDADPRSVIRTLSRRLPEIARVSFEAALNDPDISFERLRSLLVYSDILGSQDDMETAHDLLTPNGCIDLAVRYKPRGKVSFGGSGWCQLWQFLSQGSFPSANASLDNQVKQAITAASHASTTSFVPNRYVKYIHIVAGRRHMLTDTDNSYRQEISEWAERHHNIRAEIMTYDRVAETYTRQFRLRG